MTSLAAAAALCIALAVTGCGESGTPTGAAETEGPFGAVSPDEGNGPPKVVPPDRPPPKKVVFRDIEVGSGPVARRGDRVALHYAGFNYRTGEKQYPGRWPPDEPLAFRLGSGYVNPAWEEAIVGMRVGGRRELIIPSRLLFRTGTIDYVVDLLAIKGN